MQQPGIPRFLSFFTKKLRLSNPWNFKAPLLISIPYLVLFLSRCNRPYAFVSILASITIIIGIAGIGYLTNDLGDREKDRQINKENATAGLSAYGIALLFALFLGLAVLPWLYLPINGYGALLFALQIALFCAYAFPPMRLKEKGFAGIITDALYAHVNPALLAAYTFWLYCGQNYGRFHLFAAALCSWQFFLGLRNILFHQLKDYEDDLRSGTKTFVTKAGKEKSIALLRRLLLPAEVVFFFVFLDLILLQPTPLIALPAVCLAYWAIALLKNRRRLKQMDYRAKAYVFLDDLYTKWLPLFVLAGLVAQSRQYLIVLALHLLIFNNGIRDLVRKWIKR